MPRFPLMVALAAALGLVSGERAAAQQQPPPTVTVETLSPQSVQLSSTLPGRVRASSEAEVRPQVSGIVTERLFEEGAMVEAGDVLYRIEAASYEAAVAQARASVAQAEAQLRVANREAERIQTLSDRGISAASTQDDAISTRDSAAAALDAAKAQLTAAEIELDHTEIKARLTGRIGFSQTNQGALVTASQAAQLSVIRTLDPVYVDVTQSAADLLSWRRSGAPSAAEAPREVTLQLADGTTYAETGRLSAAEPHVDEATGVVVLRMSFANPDGLLLPGMYVQVDMPTSTAENVFLVPQEGVSRDRRGNPTALVVNADNVVESRDLNILQDRGTDWIVDSGLEDGDRIIVAGVQKAAPGATVTPEERTDDAEDQAANNAAASGETRELADASDTEGPAEGGN